ncbi:hypothetical protein [Flammeovirga pacifica]|uniref:TonB C-terminal domain-containing protein n=1 Tax=Flammeovirga pacifica TaxID=915059 RepID=A0A1S1YZN9_FLAPC|nr:hypothetical protein [Flammeovirga pacifica]OHX66479.1 hypothetical protein NH26_08980 [Flammeovirga pacifica]
MLRILLLTFCFPILLSAQNKVYLDKWGNVCAENEAKTFYTSQKVDLKGVSLFEIKSYTNNNVLITKGYKDNIQTGRYINEFYEYFRNGKVSRIYHYDISKKDVFVETFYNNGIKRSELILIGGYKNEKYLNAWNEKGEQIAESGVGRLEWRSEVTNNLYGGKLSDFHKVGEWTGYNDELKVSYKEFYREDGSLQKGVATRESDQQTFSYKDQFVYPYIKNYPLYKKVRAKVNKILSDNNKKYVYIKVFVNKEGEGVHAKMQYSDQPNSESEKEALEIVNKYLQKFDFEPAKRLGISTDAYTNFKFNLEQPSNK